MITRPLVAGKNNQTVLHASMGMGLVLGLSKVTLKEDDTRYRFHPMGQEGEK